MLKYYIYLYISLCTFFFTFCLWTTEILIHLVFLQTRFLLLIANTPCLVFYCTTNLFYWFLETIYMSNKSNKLQILFTDLTFAFYSYSQCLWRRQWQPTPLLLPGESHGQKSLAVYSPWGHKRVRLDWVTIQLQQNVFLQPMPILTTYQFFSRLWRTFLLFFLTSAFGFWVFLSACQGQCDGYGIQETNRCVIILVVVEQILEEDISALNQALWKSWCIILTLFSNHIFLGCHLKPLLSQYLYWKEYSIPKCS